LPIGKAGVLEGRNATTYHLNNSYRQKELAEFGVNVMNEPIVVDKNIITSYSPQTANDVAFIMLERLLEKRKLIGLEKECLDEIKYTVGKSIVWNYIDSYRYNIGCSSFYCG